jgi:ParB/RepB/Spo0J family partition protein
MTSGIFRSVPISSVTIPPDRQRKEFSQSDIDALADSIKRLGLIHPLLVDESGSLIAGERRLIALNQLGWTQIPVQLSDELDERTRRALELEENTKRVDLTWQEKAAAVRDFHTDRVSEVPEWTLEDTGAALGYDKTWVSNQLAVGKELATNVAVAGAPKLSTAIGIVRRKLDREKQSHVANLVRAAGFEKPGETLSSVAAWEPIAVGDFNAFANSYSGEPFNLVHCDFPYGIGADRNQQGYAVEEHGGYEDTADVYFQLLDTFVNNCDRFVAESAHLVFWFSMKYYTETLAMIRRTRFVVDDFPFVWIKDVGLLPDPNRGPRRVYETAFFGRAGDRKIVRAVSNAIQAPRGSDHIHMSVKPVPVLEHFFRMLVDGTTTLFDPTAGGGTALQAALGLGARSADGLELNPDFAGRANAALQKQRVELLKKEERDA